MYTTKSSYLHSNYYFDQSKSKRRVIPLSIIAEKSLAINNPNKPSAYCKECNKRYILDFLTFARTKQNFAESAHYCKLCQQHIDLIKM